MSLFIGENETDDDLKITVARASNKYLRRISVKTLCVTSKILAKLTRQNKTGYKNFHSLLFHDGEQNVQNVKINEHNQTIDG